MIFKQKSLEPETGVICDKFSQHMHRYCDTFKTKIKTKPSVQDQDQDFASQDQDQDLFEMYTRGRPKSTFYFQP